MFNKNLAAKFHIKAHVFFVSPSHPQNPPPSKKIHTCFCCRGVSVNNSTLTCYLQFLVLRKISKKPDSRICVSTSLGPLDILDGEQLNPCQLKPDGFSGKRLYTFQVTKLCYYLMAFSTVRKLRIFEHFLGFWLPAGSFVRISCTNFGVTNFLGPGGFVKGG